MDIKTVQYLAALARIHISDEEMEGFSKDLANILAFIDQISSVPVDMKSRGLSTHRNISRHDEVLPLAAAYDLIEAAPLHHDHFVKVPKVIE